MELLPLTEPVLLILLSLADHPRHGYAILQDTQEMSGGRVRLSTGTLYGALRRLLHEGLPDEPMHGQMPKAGIPRTFKAAA